MAIKLRRTKIKAFIRKFGYNQGTSNLAMKLIVRTTLILSLFVAASAAAAQVAPPKLPFAVGEELNYEGKISKIISVGGIADMTFTVAKDPNSENFLIKTKANSKGTLLKLFRYSFIQEYESIVDFRANRVIKTTKHDVQKDRVRDSVADFDYEQKRVSFVETDPTNLTRPPRKIASKIEDQVHDLVTGIYFMRTQPMAIGKTFDVVMSDSGLVYRIPVRVTAREKQRSTDKKVWCWRVEPAIFGPGRLIDQKGNMIIWISDDESRTPIRSIINASFGKLDIRLKSANK